MTRLCWLPNIMLAAQPADCAGCQLVCLLLLAAAGGGSGEGHSSSAAAQQRSKCSTTDAGARLPSTSALRLWYATKKLVGSGAPAAQALRRGAGGTLARQR
jgi:hypothetical protein